MANDYNPADTRFMRKMIDHHEMALGMSDAVLKDGKNSDVESLARSIKSSQQKEIATMKKWLEDRDLSENSSGSM